MTPARTHLTRDDLAPLARAAPRPHAHRRHPAARRFEERRLPARPSTTVRPRSPMSGPRTRTTGGGPTPTSATPSRTPSGIGLFLAAHHRLTELGVRVPRLLFADREAVHLPAYAAVVEDIPGANAGAAAAGRSGGVRVPWRGWPGVLGVLRGTRPPGTARRSWWRRAGTASGVPARRSPPTGRCATSRTPPSGTPGARGLRWSDRGGCGTSRTSSHRAATPPSCTANSARTTSWGPRTATRRSLDIEGLMYFDAGGSTSSSSSARTRLRRAARPRPRSGPAGPVPARDAPRPGRRTAAAARRRLPGARPCGYQEFNLRRALALLPAASLIAERATPAGRTAVDRAFLPAGSARCPVIFDALGADLPCSTSA